MTKCQYLKCRFNCRNINEHKIIYARMRRFYDTNKKSKKNKKFEKKLSSKVNWKVYNEFIIQNRKY